MSRKREWVARIVYETWATLPGYVDWQDRGNSDKQEDARAVANYILHEVDETKSYFWLGMGCGIFTVAVSAGLLRIAATALGLLS